MTCLMGNTPEDQWFLEIVPEEWGLKCCQQEIEESLPDPHRCQQQIEEDASNQAKLDGDPLTQERCQIKL
jgi:hypothetical protein